MKKVKASAKKRKQLNEKRLTAYTAATGAALLAASPADAAIQYSGVVDVTVSNSSAFIDIDGDATNDLKFWNDVVFSTSGIAGWDYRGETFNVTGNVTNLNAFSFAGAPGDPSNLDAGTTIDSSKSWNNNAASLFNGRITKWFYHPISTWESFVHSTQRIRNGNFTNPGYLGLRFDPGDGIKYGWIHIVVDDVSYTNVENTYPTYTIDGWAYEDSGQAIMAGQTVVPEPTSIALFAAGAATIMAKRRRKKR